MGGLQKRDNSEYQVHLFLGNFFLCKGGFTDYAREFLILRHVMLQVMYKCKLDQGEFLSVSNVPIPTG